MSNGRYKQYILVLDPNDKDDTELIEYLEKKHSRKRKNSFSAMLRAALEFLKASENNGEKE